MSHSVRFPTLYPGMRVRVRNRNHRALPVGLAEGDEVEVMRLDGFVVLVRDDDGHDWPVCIDNLVPPDFIFTNGRWVSSEQLQQD
ncbi:hypothetical protein ACXR0O_14600 [Verrucomicrobiota bacterium sgz303538]